MLILLFLYFVRINSFEVTKHPLEPRCAYVSGLDIRQVILGKDLCYDSQEASSDVYLRRTLYKLFDKYPLLIFKNKKELKPKEFIDFLTIFDSNCDKEAIKYPNENPSQMLQLLNQIPDCNHVALQGNFYKKNIFNLKELTVIPKEPFISNYVWQVNLLGHKTKLPNIVTGINIVEQPLIGGETEFISGETVYENLSDDIKNASKNIIMEINHEHFKLGGKLMDYSGTKRLKKCELKLENHNTLVPLVFAPESDKQIPRILMTPSLFEKVSGWDEEESQKWMTDYMYNYVLPHRFSIQWKKGDICVFNNRRFMHSSSPAMNYMKFNDYNERLLLQTFLPTKIPFFAAKSPYLDKELLYKIGWCDSVEKSHRTTQNAFEYAVASIVENKAKDLNINKYNLDEKKYFIYMQKS
jgi:hypothetical protein